MEYLTRGLVALEVDNGIFLWRMQGTDSTDIRLNIYRNGEKADFLPISTVTIYMDGHRSKTDKYAVDSIKIDVNNKLSNEISVWPFRYPTNPYTPGKPPMI